MSGQELRVITAVAILSGTLVIGLEQVATQPIGNAIRLAQNANQGSSGGGDNAGGVSLSGEIDPRDNSRLDNRHSMGFSGQAGAAVRDGSLSGLQLGPAEFDSRRDNSRLDTRQTRTPAIVPSGKDETR